MIRAINSFLFLVIIQLSEVRMFFKLGNRGLFWCLIVSMIVIAIFLPWVQSKYEGFAAVASLPFNLPFVGSSLNWLYWYILVSLTIGWIVNKLFGAT